MLVGLVALILLGPRKLPEMARKAGKIMSEKKERKTDDGEEAGQAGPGNFEFEVGAEDSA